MMSAAPIHCKNIDTVLDTATIKSTPRHSAHYPMNGFIIRTAAVKRSFLQNGPQPNPASYREF